MARKCQVEQVVRVYSTFKSSSKAELSENCAKGLNTREQTERITLVFQRATALQKLLIKR